MIHARLKLLLRGVVSVALIALVLRKVQLRDLAAVLAQVDFTWAFLGSILTPALIAALACRWLLFLRQQSIDLSVRSTVSLTWAGLFFNACLPGSMGGDVVRILHLCRRVPHARAAAAGTVLADRASALFALLLLALIGVAVEPAPLRLFANSAPPLRVLLPVLVVATTATVVVLWLVRQHRWLAQTGTIVRGVTGALRPSSSLALGFLVALAIHLLNFLIVFFFTRALGIGVTYRQVVLMMSVVFFAMLLPVTINGHGLRELLFIGYFNQLGITLAGTVQTSAQGMAVALSVLIVVNELLWVVPGGVWYFWCSRAGRPQQAPAAFQA